MIKFSQKHFKVYYILGFEILLINNRYKSCFTIFI